MTLRGGEGEEGVKRAGEWKQKGGGGGGLLLELIDSRCVFQINQRDGLCLYCKRSSVMALRVY